MTTRHLTDDELAALVLDTGAPAVVERHLRSCAGCEARRDGLSRLLDDLSASADRETDAHFSAAHLAHQRARLLRRLEQDGGLARVLVFPAGRQDRRVFRSRPTTRWIAAAAAAGMAVGLVVGRLSSGPSPRPGVAARVALSSSAPRATSGFAPATAVLSDDELMGEIELAVARPWSGLEPIHALTPP